MMNESENVGDMRNMVLMMMTTTMMLDVPVYAGHVDKKNFGSC